MLRIRAPRGMLGSRLTRRVLIVDDQRLFADTLAESLRSSDIDVVGVAYDSASGLQRFQELAPDILLLEYHLAGGNGAQIAGAVRRLGLPVRIVVLTADPSQWVRDECIRNGADEVITKELGLAAIADALVAAR